MEYLYRRYWVVVMTRLLSLFLFSTAVSLFYTGRSRRLTSQSFIFFPPHETKMLLKRHLYLSLTLLASTICTNHRRTAPTSGSIDEEEDLKFFENTASEEVPTSDLKVPKIDTVPVLDNLPKLE
jgi:hypothetical protein